MPDVTQILQSFGEGNEQAASQLLPLVYDELRKLAAQRMAAERLDHTLQATALVHEAYVRLVDVDDPQGWESRGHFFAAAAEAMRRILVDQARKKGRLKRGGGISRVDLDAIDIAQSLPADAILSIDEAISRFAEHDRDACNIVKLRYFGGMTIDESARLLGMSTRTVYRHWSYARAWLSSELLDDAS